MNLTIFLMFTAALSAVEVSTSFTNGYDLIPRNLTSAEKQLVPLDSDMPDFIAEAQYQNDNARESSRKTVITLLASTSYGNEMPAGPIATKPMELALDRLHSQASWLSNYELVIEIVDDECVDSETINKVIPRLRRNDEAVNRFPLFISPACETVGIRTVAEAVRYFDFTAVTTTYSSQESFLDRKRFSSYFGMGERVDAGHIAMVEFIRQMGWRKVAILSENFPFYDDLEKSLLPRLDAANITLLWIGKTSHASVEDDEMTQAFDEMIPHDPRIIIVDADCGAGKACWLHRFGMYGPNYVLFFFYWSDVFPKASVPDNISWCTEAMINEVMASSFIFGDTSIINTYGPTIKDSSGISASQWESELKTKIEDPEKSDFWSYWRPMGYDLVLFAGYLLNNTERLLNQRNETLLDWVTTSDNFQKNGHVISNVLKKALYSTSVTGFKGDYHFENRTTVNSGGYVPVTFTQIQTKPGRKHSDHVIIAIYKSNEKSPLSIFRDQIVWQTQDGLPPKDSVKRVQLEIKSISIGLISALFAMAAFEILLAFIILLLAAIKEFALQSVPFRVALFLSEAILKGDDATVLVGNLIMACQILATPFDGHGTKWYSNCSLMSAFLVIGYSCSIYGILAKLEQIKRRQTEQAAVLLRFRNKIFVSAGPILHAIWMILQICLVSAFLSLSPPLLSKEIIDSYALKSDKSIIYEHFQYQCKFVLKGESCVALIIAIVIFHVLVLLRAIFLCIALRSIRLSRENSNALKRISRCIYCIILLFIGGGLAVLSVGDYAKIVISFITISYVALTTTLIILVRVQMRNQVFGTTINVTSNGTNPTFPIPSRGWKLTTV